MSLYYLIYVSSATKEMNETELAELHKSARIANKEHNITGMLLYKGGNFMQMLEGDRETVLELFELIKRDPRHKDILTILTGEIEKRNFDDWSMGFCHMDTTGNLPNYLEFIDKSLLSRHFQQDSQDAYRFIVSFNDWMRE